MRALGVPVIRKAGWEADDLVGTLAQQAIAAGKTAAMVTPDKDYGQLVADGISWWKPGRRGDAMEKCDSAAVCERWGGIASPAQVIDILALMGDASDNIPGVKGVGEKTAIGWVKEFGSLENIYENIEQIKVSAEYLERDREMAFLSKELVTIDQQSPISVEWDDLLLSSPDQTAMSELCDELEFRTLRKRLLATPSTAAIATVTPEQKSAEGAVGDDTAKPAGQCVVTMKRLLIIAAIQQRTTIGNRSCKKHWRSQRSVSILKPTPLMLDVRCHLVLPCHGKQERRIICK